MSELSKFEALERKITQAIEKVALLKEEKTALQGEISELKASNAKLRRQVDGMKRAPAKAPGPDLKRIRGQVDSLLEKIEALEL